MEIYVSTRKHRSIEMNSLFRKQQFGNEQRLKSFMEAIAKTSLPKKDPMCLNIEELAIRKMWERVHTQKEKRQYDEERERAEATESANERKALVNVAPSIILTQ